MMLLGESNYLGEDHLDYDTIAKDITKLQIESGAVAKAL